MAINEWIQINDKIRRKVFPPGEKMMSMAIAFEQGGIGPEHSHPHEQTGYVISGKIQMSIAGETFIFSEGDFIQVPSGVPHAVLALEKSLVLENFTPIREDLLSG